MNYSVEIEIDKPIDEVIELFDSTENMSKWMEGLQSFEPLSGTPGEEGAKSRLKFDMNGRQIEMVETITKKNLPDEFTGTYEADGVFNIVKNTFISEDMGTTRWISKNEFQFNSFPMKIMGFLMPGMFRKQSLKNLESFKEFAESE
ncbi:MAG: SRPBCC family protein [Pyrinomonadaceae bacterium]|nr:SRPBCC family protein [Pyrinomonadaceae bacterium]